MEFVTISGTNLTASRIGLGTWAMGGWMWGGSDEEDRFARFGPRWIKGST